MENVKTSQLAFLLSLHRSIVKHQGSAHPDYPKHCAAITEIRAELERRKTLAQGSAS